MEQHDIDRFEGEGGRVVHMSDGHDVRQSEAADYKRTHPGVREVQEQAPTQRPVTGKLTQGN